MMCKLIKWSEFDQLISTRDGRHKEEWATSLVVDVSGNMSHQTFVLCLAFCNSIPYV